MDAVHGDWEEADKAGMLSHCTGGGGSCAGNSDRHKRDNKHAGRGAQHGSHSILSCIPGTVVAPDPYAFNAHKE